MATRGAGRRKRKKEKEKGRGCHWREQTASKKQKQIQKDGGRVRARGGRDRRHYRDEDDGGARRLGVLPEDARALAPELVRASGVVDYEGLTAVLVQGREGAQGDGARPRVHPRGAAVRQLAHAARVNPRGH
jgi:hypothetical protein